MRIGKAPAPEIRHRVGFPPDDIIQNPEVKILQGPAKTVDIVIAANDPQRTIGLQDPPRLGKPRRRKLIIGGKGIKLVPGIINTINRRMIRTGQIAAKLQIIGGVGENKIDAGRRKLLQLLEAIPFNDNVLFDACHFFSLSFSALTPQQDGQSCRKSTTVVGLFTASQYLV